MGFIFGLIGSVILGALTGVLARAVLPGTQNIGWGKTIGLGVVANFLTSLFLGSILGPITGLIAGVVVGAGILWFSIDKGYLTPGGRTQLKR